MAKSRRRDESATALENERPPLGDSGMNAGGQSAGTSETLRDRDMPTPQREDAGLDEDRPVAQQGPGAASGSDMPAPQNAGDTTAANVDRERCAARAYELYLERGGGEGRDMDDWLQAERELSGRSRGSDES